MKGMGGETYLTCLSAFSVCIMTLASFRVCLVILQYCLRRIYHTRYVLIMFIRSGLKKPSSTVSFPHQSGGSVVRVARVLQQVRRVYHGENLRAVTNKIQYHLGREISCISNGVVFLAQLNVDKAPFLPCLTSFWCPL